MKKLILAIAIAFTGFSVGNAQFMESLQIGVKGGYNYSSLSIADKLDTFKADGLHGFHLGLFVEVPIMDKLSVQPEVVYSTQGDSYSYKNQISVASFTNSLEIEANYKLNYLNVPIMFKYYVIDGLSIDFGPQIGFLSSSNIKGKVTLTSGSQTQEKEYTIDGKDYIKSIDYGLGLGATYKIEAIEGLAISARYNLGLSDISKGEVKNNNGNSSGIIDIEDYSSILSSKNRFIQVGLSYQL